MIKSLFKSFGYKTVQTIVLTLYSVLLIPILLNYWELKVYGAWIALFTVFNLIQVIEFGHATYIGNQFNAIVKENAEKAKTVLGSALRANFITGFIQITIVFLLFKSGFLKFLLDTDISDKTIATVLTILFLYRMLAGSFRGIIVKILNPFGLIYKSFQFATWERIIDFFILVIAAITDITLIQLAIVWFVVKSVYSIGLLFILKRLLPDFFPWWKYGNFKLGTENFKDSIPFIFSNFLERLRNDGVVLIISAFIGTTFLPLFVATRAVVNFGLKISEIILNPLSPEVINLYVKNKLNKILDIFNAYWFSTGLLLISGYSISLFFINDLFTFWTHGKLTFNLGLYSALVVIFLIQNYGKIIFMIGALRNMPTGDKAAKEIKNLARKKMDFILDGKDQLTAKEQEILDKVWFEVKFFSTLKSHRNGIVLNNNNDFNAVIKEYEDSESSIIQLEYAAFEHMYSEN